MSPLRWREVQRLFGLAYGHPAAGRESFLRSQCSDIALVDDVLRLVAVRTPPDFLVPPRPEEARVGWDLGDFTLVEEIGHGGMGVVYKAVQKSLARVVAVKVLPASLTLSRRQVERFQREARAAARLDHPGIASILVVGEENGMHYFAMEYVQGRNLAEEIACARRSALPADEAPACLPPADSPEYVGAAAEIVLQAADALGYAHRQGIVHRDVKPSNLLLDANRRLKIVDFGLAGDETRDGAARAGECGGTAQYMSPEQHRGQRLDPRTDVYALGVVLYELLTLRCPFDGGNEHDVMQSVLEREPPGVRELNRRVPHDLEVICAKAMAKAATQRYADAGALAADLARFLAHEAIHAQPPSWPRRLLRKLGRQRRALAGACFGLALGATGILMVLAHQRQERLRTVEVEIATALDEVELRDLPIGRLVHLRTLADEARRLHAGRVVFAAERSNVLRRLADGFVSLRDELYTRGVDDLRCAKEPGQPENIREFHLLRGQQTLLQASYLFPDDLELRELAALETAFPTIEVEARDASGTALSAEVYLRTIDVLTSAVGEAVHLGPTPLAPTPVRAGYYRVVVAFADGGFRELACNPGLAVEHVELLALRRTDEAAIEEGMIRFGSVPYTIPDDAEIEWALESRTAAVEEFLLDATEVSNAEYSRFVCATGHPQPRYWRFVDDFDEFLERYGDRPVVGVGWRDAVAYAEWRGKRLPTAAEWLLAAGGVENRPFPYSDQRSAPVRGNVAVASAPNEGPADAWADYLSNSASVTSHPAARTPEGLFHMFGNVLEFTESMMVDALDESVLMPRSSDRISFGGSWRSQPLPAAMRLPSFWGIGPHHYDSYLGFRCAKSASPIAEPKPKGTKTP